MGQIVAPKGKRRITARQFRLTIEVATLRCRRGGRFLWWKQDPAHVADGTQIQIKRL